MFALLPLLVDDFLESAKRICLCPHFLHTNLIVLPCTFSAISEPQISQSIPIWYCDCALYSSLSFTEDQ